MSEYREILELVKPSQVFLYNISSNYQSLETYLLRLLGALKYAVRQGDGVEYMNDLVEVTGQSNAAIRAGLSYLQATGTITFTMINGRSVKVNVGQGSGCPKDANTLLANLNKALNETSAFRMLYPGMSPVLFC